jgi:tetratricopeptide (TPR) repeat protein
MNMPSFAPQVAQSDKISSFFSKITRQLLVAVVAVLPILIIPGLLPLTNILKVYVVLGVLLLACITHSLAVLRRGEITVRFPRLLMAAWGVAVSAIVAGLMAPQVSVAFVGIGLEIHTVGFLLLAIAMMTAMLLLSESKSSVVYLYGGLFISAFILSIFHISRLIFGPEWLSFGVFGNQTASPIGSFNDLALFFTLVVMVGLISLLQLSLPRLMSYVLTTIMVLSILMLTIINFVAVWFVLGLFGLLILMYSLTKGRIGAVKATTQPSVLATILSLVIFVVSLVFIIGGSALGTVIAAKTGISYLEVRPSMSATLDIAKATYQQNALTGIGPNHFNEAWTLYKDNSLNETLFWNTAFNAGSGYVPTWFVTAGVLAVIAWLAFIIVFLREGVKTLLRPVVTDQFWYFVATISFTVAAFVMFISFLYVPGPVLILLGFINLGLFVVASEVLTQERVRTVNLLTNTKTGFVLIAVVMCVIIGSVSVGYQAFRQVLGLSTFASALAIPPSETQAAEVTTLVARAYSLHNNDSFVRDLAQYQLQEMRVLATKTEPTTADTQRFGALVTAALEASTAAINERGSDARNWSLRGDIYTALATAKIEGAYDRAMADYKEAEVRDPHNPYYHVQRAILELTKDNRDGARAALGESLKRKSNYSDALILLSELDIASGNVEEAIKTTTALASLEPNNPGRYYQLGILYSAKGDHETAVRAFIDAIARNPQFANARYLLALELLVLGNKEEALKELATVRDLNPDNTVVNDVIAKIERGEITADTIKNGQPTTVAEPTPEVTDGEVTTVDTLPETDLLSPVNTVTGSTTDTVTE